MTRKLFGTLALTLIALLDLTGLARALPSATALTASEDSPLGIGWSHSLDMKLYGLSTEEAPTARIPSWVAARKGQLFRPGSVSVPTEAASGAGWTLVSVNGRMRCPGDD